MIKLMDLVNEISKKKAMDAYAQRSSYASEDDYDDEGKHAKKAEKTKAHIEKKFGKEAGEDAERHADVKWGGRGMVDKNNKGKHSTDKLDPKRSGADNLKKNVTKKGKMSKGYQKGMKSVINSRSPNVKNPETGKTILAKTAYAAGPDHPAYSAAKKKLNK